MRAELVWPWVTGAVAVAVVVALVLTRRRAQREVRWLAHTAWVAQVPAVVTALRRAAVLRALAVVAVVAVLVGGAVLAGRPVERRMVAERLGTRDIVLCLDVSGSMLPYDAAVVQTFSRLVDGFQGERLALSIWNSTSRTVFPLTDDYDLALTELASAREALDVDLDTLDPASDASRRLDSLLAGTQGVANQGSLIGDGLAGCSLLFDEQNTERSRSIVLATDNEVYGDPIYALTDATALAASRGVRVYGLFGSEDLQGSPEDVEFTEAITAVGGRTWYANDPAAVDEIVADVVAEQAQVLAASPRVETVDRQGPWFALAAVGLVLLLGARSVSRR